MIGTRVRAALAATTIAGGITAALLAPGGAAVADESGGLVLDVSVSSTATLVARGAAVEIGIDYTCNTSSYTYLSASVTQRVGSEIANGGGQTQVTCDGTPQHTVITVLASDGKAFRRGEAVATGYINGCANYCGSDSATATIQIDR